MIVGIEMSHMTDHASFKGHLSSVCWDLIYSIRAKFDHYGFNPSKDIVRAHQNLNGSRDLTMSLSGIICHAWASACYINLPTKFELSASI